MAFSFCVAAWMALAILGVDAARAQFEEPEVEEPEFQEPEFEEPEVEEPEFHEPEFEEPEVEEPEFQEPEFEEPEVEEPEFQEPEFEEPEVEEPEFQEPEFEEPEIGEMEVEEPELETYEHEDEPETDGADYQEVEQESDLEDDLTNDSELAGETSAPLDLVDAEEWKADLARGEEPEYDADGYPVRHGELIALNLSRNASALLTDKGFSAVHTTNLAAIDLELTRLAVPEGLSAQAALALARSLDPTGTYDLGHYYGTPYAQSGTRQAGGAGRLMHSVPGRNLRLGMIDTTVERGPALGNVDFNIHHFGLRQHSGESEHGTAVASILASEGAGALLVANVFEKAKGGHFTSAEVISRAIAWLLAEDVGVINISLTGPRNAVLDTVVSRAISRGAIIVAAAGNGGPTAPPAYPAALPNVVAVTAVDSSRRVYRYANRGDYIRLAAHGVHIAVPFADDETRYFSGTSFAAPRVAARIAACATRSGTPASCVTELERTAIDLGAPGRDVVYGFGLVE